MHVTNFRAAPNHLSAPVAALWLVVAASAVAEPLPGPAMNGDAEILPSAVVDDGSAGVAVDPAVVAFGAGGCATSSCHGGPEAGNHAVHSFAATLWAKGDPHAGAYETLHEPRSRTMAALLGIGEAHEARQCLACHSTQASSESPLPPEVLADGVSCGACHGDATRWVAVHTLPDWKGLDAEARAALGHRDLADVTSRARTCIPCHVGDESREVNHDMIAAGHPRLAFEFAAYQRRWPRHWSPQARAEAQADFTERSWAAGQAETLAAVARLLAVRARRAAADDRAGNPAGGATPAARWPEFAEFDCYSCHRALSPERVAGTAAGEFPNPAPGTPTWQPWNVAAARLLAVAVGDPDAADVGRAAIDVREVFAPGWSTADRERLERVVARARALERAAERAAAALAARDVVVLDSAPERLDALVAADRAGWRHWDAAAQTYLLLDSAVDGGPARIGLWGAAPAPTETRTALDAMRASLRFPPGAGGPDGFDPGRFQRDRAALPQRRGGAR